MTDENEATTNPTAAPPAPEPLAGADDSDFVGPDLATTLLVRLGLMTPAEAEAHAPKPPTIKRRRLRTPNDVVKAIADVVHALDRGLNPATARARLYALQTMLVAMRMQPAVDELPANTTLTLNAVAEAPAPPTQPDALHQVAEMQHLTHLQHMTAEDHGV